MAVSSTESIPNAVSADLSWRLVRPAGRAGDLVAFDEAVVTFFLEAATLLGVPKSVAAIYGICFASAEPLSFSEIQARLDISAGSISQGLRVLREVGALKVASPATQRVGRPSSQRVGRPSSQRVGRSSSQMVGRPDGQMVSRSSSQMARRPDDQMVGVRPSDHPTLRPSGHPTIRPSGLAYFEPDLELRKLVAHFIEERLEKQLRAGKGRLQEIKKAVPAGNGSAKVLKSRVKALQSWHNKGHALLPVMKTFLALP